MFPHRHAAPNGLAGIAWLLLGESRAVAQATIDPSPAVPTLHPAGLHPVVRMAVLEAHRRLGDVRCQEIFSDFQDVSGDAPQRRLDPIGQSGQSYLGWMWFVDAGSGGRCAESEVFAFTTPGSQVVHFCGDRFTRQIQRRGLGPLVSVILHEELHSLGLAENPPTSTEITRRVEFRCGP